MDIFIGSTLAEINSRPSKTLQYLNLFLKLILYKKGWESSLNYILSESPLRSHKYISQTHKVEPVSPPLLGDG
jgi:hypothetical protein